MPSSNWKVIANRINGQKSHGPINTTSTRFNATKHGLLAIGITELDDMEGYYTTVKDLTSEKNPLGVVERFLVQSLALDMVRWQRARRLEAEFITGVLNPRQHEKDPLNELDFAFNGPVLDPGLPAAIDVGSAQYLVGTFQRYESFFANRWFRTLHELERVQRMRQGERVPAPTAVDVSVRAETGRLDSVAAGPEQAKSQPRDVDSLPRPVTEDVILADTGTVDSVPAAVEQLESLSGGVDVNLAHAGIVDSVPAAVEHPKPLSGDGDVNVYADTGVVDSAPTPLGQVRARPGDEE